MVTKIPDALPSSVIRELALRAPSDADCFNAVDEMQHVLVASRGANEAIDLLIRSLRQLSGITVRQRAAAATVHETHIAVQVINKALVMCDELPATRAALELILTATREAQERLEAAIDGDEPAKGDA